MTKTIVMIEQSEIRQLIHEELQKFFDMFKETNSSTEEWIDSKDVPAYLSVSRKTWQNYRNQRLIPFSQVGRKIRVRKSDLDAFLETYMVNPVVELNGRRR